MATVLVQKYFRGQKVNRPFSIRKENANRLIEANKGQETEYKLVENAVPEVRVPVQKKSNPKIAPPVVNESKARDIHPEANRIVGLSVKDAVPELTEIENLHLLNSIVELEQAGKNRKGIIVICQNKIKELS